MMLLFVFIFALEAGHMDQDTISLSQVEVYAPKIERFSQGQKVEDIAKKDLQTYQARSLGDLLQERSPLFIRQYGAGMLASPSFRGTSAGHTAVFWNGLPVNSPALGQSDLSIFPVQAFDQVELQYGNSGALFGNEAIGGSIHLGSQLDFGTGFKAQVNQQFGSFGLINAGLSLGFSNEKISARSKFYRLSVENDFSYSDLGQPETPTIRQQHAAVNQLGFLQDLAWNVAANQQVKLSYWWSQADREIQPVLGSQGGDIQLDENHRLVLDYFFFGKNSTLNFKTGFVLDRQLFNASQNNTDQYFFSGDWDKNFNEKWSFKAGLRYTRAEGDLSTYSAIDERLEAYQSLRFVPSERLSISANFRELAFTEGDLPFVPSFGMDWELISANSFSALIKVSAGRGFKIPTLNDRFWEPGGNPDLLPEESLNGEIGAHFSGGSAMLWKSSLTYYHMEVDNWIIWLPQGAVWTPDNIREVRNQGIEFDFKLGGKLMNWNWGFSGAYTYSRAVSTGSMAGELIPKGSQLPYTPEHQANARIRIQRSGFDLTASTFFVGKRSITADAIRPMPSYQLVNLGLGYSRIQLGKIKIPLSFQINNLLNKDYQVLYLRAMPGRSYQFNLTLIL